MLWYVVIGVIVRSVQVLHFDAGNVEATACLGSFQFYADQPEVAMVYFRRILQLGTLIVVVAMTEAQ